MFDFCHFYAALRKLLMLRAEFMLSKRPVFRIAGALFLRFQFNIYFFIKVNPAKKSINKNEETEKNSSKETATSLSQLPPEDHEINVFL